MAFEVFEESFLLKFRMKKDLGRVEIQMEIVYKNVGVLPIRIVNSNVSSVGPSSEKNRALRRRANRHSDERPTLEMLDFIIRIGSTPTFLYFDLHKILGYR